MAYLDCADSIRERKRSGDMPPCCACRSSASTACWFPDDTAKSNRTFKSASGIPGGAAGGSSAADGNTGAWVAAGTAASIAGINGADDAFGVITTVGAGAIGGGGTIRCGCAETTVVCICGCVPIVVIMVACACPAYCGWMVPTATAELYTGCGCDTSPNCTAAACNAWEVFRASSAGSAAGTATGALGGGGGIWATTAGRAAATNVAGWVAGTDS
mmetsp:Transcript_118242/g.329782  ORF Transcript_118242/g.329782 Transcript_118242/m.329782 type:complete len:216 (+) Transcript_118242:144-791(+)